METNLNDIIVRTDRAYRNVKLSNYSTVFQTEKGNKTSEKYSFVSTLQVLENLADNNWLPSQVIEMKTRNQDNRGFQKHAIRLSNQKLNAELGLVTDLPEILLINSHNAGSSFQLMLGLFRTVCSNGLITGTSYADHRVTHIGYTDTLITNAVKAITNDAPKVIEQIEQFKSIVLKPEEQTIFAQSAIELIKDPENQSLYVDPRYLLSRNRQADKNADLWSTFNSVQENITKGKYYVQNKEKRQSRRARKINSIDRDCSINRALWTMTEKMAELTNN